MKCRPSNYALVLLMVGSLLVAPTFAQTEWEGSQLPPGPPSSPIVLNGGSVSITQSNDPMTVTPLNSVACPGDDDRYFRRFDLTMDGINTAFTVNSIDLGIENSTGAGAGITVNIYALPRANMFTLANLTNLLGTSGFQPVAAMGTIINIPINGTLLDPANDDLVVEVVALDFTNNFTFFIGSNGNGETAPSFLQADVCMAFEPTPTAAINNPQMQIVMVVNGDPAPADADLELTKSGQVSGTQISYTLTVTNNGPSDATNLMGSDSLPAEVTYVSDDCGGVNGDPWTWNVPNLANGAMASCTILVDVMPGFTGNILNTASVVADNSDPVTANNIGSTTVTIGSILEIPTLGEVGLLCLVLALAGLGLWKLRR